MIRNITGPLASKRGGSRSARALLGGLTLAAVTLGAAGLGSGVANAEPNGAWGRGMCGASGGRWFGIDGSSVDGTCVYEVGGLTERDIIRGGRPMQICTRTCWRIQ